MAAHECPEDVDRRAPKQSKLHMPSGCDACSRNTRSGSTDGSLPKLEGLASQIETSPHQAS